ncbi:hypothetical protein Are01nite_10930 [Actinoplanes regularis]|nr:hypothetical protein Are01nite_10930 [Actinoplanes regularis]
MTTNTVSTCGPWTGDEEQTACEADPRERECGNDTDQTGEDLGGDVPEPEQHPVRGPVVRLPAVFRGTTTAGHIELRVQDAVARRPRVNIQDKGGKAKPYQVRQVLTAIEKLEERS